MVKGFIYKRYDSKVDNVSSDSFPRESITREVMEEARDSWLVVELDE